MPRNASGLYSLPSGNPVIPGTRITSNWANTTLGDIATALTQSLPINDGSTMTASLAGKTLTGGTFQGTNFSEPNIFGANITMDSGATVLRPPGAAADQGAFLKLESSTSDTLATSGYNIDCAFIGGKQYMRFYNALAPFKGFQLPVSSGGDSVSGLVWSSGTHMAETDRYDFLAPPDGVLKLAKQGSNGWGGQDRPPVAAYNVNDNTVLSRNCVITYDGAGGTSSGGPASAAGPLINLTTSDVLSAQIICASNLNMLAWRPRFSATNFVWGDWRTVWDAVNTPKMLTQVDTTAGAMHTNGSWGLGTQSTPVIANANLTTATGFYCTSGSTTNLPVVANGAFNVGRGPTNYVSQSFMYPSDETNIQATLGIRMYNNVGSPGPWTRVHTNFSVLGAVAISSFAIPTYASGVLERGSNANGEYAKYVDGTLICFRQWTAAITMGVYAAPINKGTATWTFPHGFQSGYPISVHAGGVDSGNTGWGSVGASLSPTSASFSYYSAAASNTSTLVQLLAIGRWY